MTEADVRRRALERVAAVFKRPVEEIRLDTEWGKELKASFVSDFRFNELDTVMHDIEDAADRQTLADMAAGRLTIATVGAYADLMVRSYGSNPEEVGYVLRRWSQEPKPRWRALLERIGW